MATYVIVGASRGMGYEYLKQLSANPANTVIGTARTPSNVEKQLAIDGLTKVHMLPGNLDDASSLKSAAAATSKITNSVDYLIVNGAFVSTATAALSPTAFDGQEDLLKTDMDQSILTNAIGPLNAINAFLPLIRAGRAKKIVVISTGMADTDFIDIANVAASVPYSVSKAAVNVIVSKFAVELKPEGISLIAMSPGLVDTEKDKDMFTYLTEMFKPYEPKFRGPITPEQSVKAQLKVIDGMSLKNTGAFISHLGNKRWLSADGVGDEIPA